MARRFRRRRQRLTWFPTLGNDIYSSEDARTRISGVPFSVKVTDQIFTREIIPLTFDKPIDESAAAADETSTLADLQGSAWAVRRIVGSLQIARGWTTGVAPNTQPAVLVRATLAVIPWDDHNDTPEADVNPISADDINEPWIWRRTLLLEQQVINPGFGANSTANAFLTLPMNSNFYPQSRFEFVDQKTSRVIHNDERLCLVIGVAGITSQNEPSMGDTIAGYFDYRLLGNLRHRSNRGRGTVH